MSDGPQQGRGPGPGAGPSSMLAWLGFFLLVFTVAGLGFYLLGEPGNGANSERPPAISQSAE